MNIRTVFDDFIEKLSKEKKMPHVTNHYSKTEIHHIIAKNNLKLYLNFVYKSNPKYIFVGEAPGYNGCKITGIPFTSEYILTNDFGNGIFGVNNGYKIINVHNPQKEPTATIVWETFNNNKKIIPCFWNIFPFHPYKEGNKLSNRKPNRSEINNIGIKYLTELIEIFKKNNKSIQVIPIGNVAYREIMKLDKNCMKIRHPANGGKSKFISDLGKLEI